VRGRRYRRRTALFFPGASGGGDGFSVPAAFLFKEEV